MTAIEILTLTFSVLSLVVATVAAVATYNNATLVGEQLRLANRTEFQKLLIELNKECIRDPSLLAVYDDHPLPKNVPLDPITVAKLEEYIYMKLNLFELVFLFFHATGSVSDAERATWSIWEAFVKHSIRNSKITQRLVSASDFEEYYSSAYTVFLRGYLPQNTGPAVS
jgi:hypothetical protein